MQWLLRFLWAVVVLLTIYMAWPLLGLKRLADVIAARDGPAFVELLDVRELKRSLAVQLVGVHLRVTGRDRRLSPLARNLAIQAGVAIADSYLVEIMNPEALLDLLNESRSEASAGGDTVRQQSIYPILRQARGLLAAEYRGRNLYVRVPLAADHNSSYRLRLRLSRWQWKLAGIDLPEPIQLRLVREFQRREANPVGRSGR